MYCIKRLEIKFERISERLIKVIDVSDFSFNDIGDLNPSKPYVLKIKTPQNEDLEVNVAPGMGAIIDLDKTKFDFFDGVYVVSTVTCSGVEVSQNVPFMHYLKSLIDNFLITQQNEKYFLNLKDQLEIVETSFKYQKQNEAFTKYDDIIEQCEGLLLPTGKAKIHPKFRGSF